MMDLRAHPLGCAFLPYKKLFCRKSCLLLFPGESRQAAEVVCSKWADISAACFYRKGQICLLLPGEEFIADGGICVLAVYRKYGD